MKGHRYKPVGWRGEPQRHYLAAKGVKTKPRRYMAYAPTYTGADLAPIAADGVGTAGAAVIPWIPVLVPLGLAYGGAVILNKRKKKTGSYFASNEDYFLPPEQFEAMEQQRNADFENNLATQIINDITIFGSPRPVPVGAYAKKDFRRAKEGEFAEYDAQPIRTKGPGSKTDFRFTAEGGATPTMSKQEKEDLLKPFPKEMKAIPVEEIPVHVPSTAELQGEFFENTDEDKRLRVMLRAMKPQERENSALLSKLAEVQERREKISAELNRRQMAQKMSDEETLKKAQQRNQKVFS